MKVEKVLVDSLYHDPRNAMKHGLKNIESIKGSLQEFGQQKPIVVDAKGKVLAGNGTLASAKALGWTHIYVVRSTLSAIKKTAYSLADNRTAELAEWDDEVLGEILAELQLKDFDLGAIGFDEDDLDKLLGDDEESESAEEIEGTTTMSDEMSLDREYMVIIFDQPKDFDKMHQILNSDAKCGYWLTKKKSNPAFFRQGPNRIMDGSSLLEFLEGRKGVER